MTHEPIQHTTAPRLKFARAVVFFSSFCLMTIEILAGRVTAPYLGVSLYTWTSVIGAVLLGVTIGNYAGGWIADRHLSHKVLGTLITLAGVATLLVGWSAGAFGPLLARAEWPIWLSSVMFACAVFFPAAFFLSTVSPQVMKFDLHDLETTGLTIGTIGAWSSIGSILGTFVTGFLFIAYVGTHQLLTAVAILLWIVGAFVAWQEMLLRNRVTTSA